MSGKFIFIIFMMVLASIFTGLNIGNKCDVWFFHSFKDVPVYMTILISFLAGVFVTFLFGGSKKNAYDERRREKEDRIREKEEKRAMKRERRSSRKMGKQESPVESKHLVYSEER